MHCSVCETLGEKFSVCSKCGCVAYCGKVNHEVFDTKNLENIVRIVRGETGPGTSRSVGVECSGSARRGIYVAKKICLQNSA